MMFPRLFCFPHRVYEDHHRPLRSSDEFDLDFIDFTLRITDVSLVKTFRLGSVNKAIINNDMEEMKFLSREQLL